jgi:hypothetical protein
VFGQTVQTVLAVVVSDAASALAVDSDHTQDTSPRGVIAAIGSDTR